MLPSASCAFDIPNINDNLELHCRLYFPRQSPSSNDVVIAGFAIFAHPYAPLGGCYDDPIVQTVGSILLKQGFLLCTFNFRGTTGSLGSTSWTGRAELADYVSVYTFILYLVNSPEVLNHISLVEGKPLIVLGGYSYGSMIASHLPDYEMIKAGHDPAQKGSADVELEFKAQEISKVLLGYLETQTHRGRAGLRVEDDTSLPNSMRGIMVGGYESENANRRISRDSPRRGVDVERVRHSVERVRNKFSRKDASMRSRENDEEHNSHQSHEVMFAVEPLVAYLLVSPLLQPVAGFTTVFSRLTFERRNAANSTRTRKSTAQNLVENPTLAIYGDKDVFTSARRLRKWSQGLQGIPNSRFLAAEIPNAGHFWHEDGILQQLRSQVHDWLQMLTGPSHAKVASQE